MDPRVKTKDVDKTISNLEKQYQEEVQKVRQKFEPVIETLSETEKVPFIRLNSDILGKENQRLEYFIYEKIQISAQIDVISCFEDGSSAISFDENTWVSV